MQLPVERGPAGEYWLCPVCAEFKRSSPGDEIYECPEHGLVCEKHVDRMRYECRLNHPMRASATCDKNCLRYSRTSDEWMLQTENYPWEPPARPAGKRRTSRLR